MIDLLEEARALEMHERLVSHQRGTFAAPELMDALTVTGHRSLGWTDAGRIEPGMRADLVAVRLDTLSTAGSLPEQVLLSAYASDVDTVVVDGRVVKAGRIGELDVAPRQRRTYALGFTSADFCPQAKELLVTLPHR